MENQNLAVLYDHEEFTQLQSDILKAIAECGKAALTSSVAAVLFAAVLVRVDLHPYSAISVVIPPMVIAMGTAFWFAMRRIDELYASFLRWFGDVMTLAQLRDSVKKDKAELYRVVALSLAGAVAGFFCISTVATAS